MPHAYVNISSPPFNAAIPAAPVPVGGGVAVAAPMLVTINSTQPTPTSGLRHWVQIFLDVVHTPGTDSIPGTTQGLVQFLDPMNPTVGTATLVPPAAAPAAGAPGYILTCWVEDDINRRYTGQIPNHEIAEIPIRVLEPVVVNPPPGPPDPPASHPPIPTL